MPRLITKKMIDAGVLALLETDLRIESHEDAVESVFRAMDKADVIVAEEDDKRLLNRKDTTQSGG
jgi:hypothetical protein